ncbi:hypothetical protein ACJRO7_030778 [Eucalyptus globulus]|uniref:Uncharacterized protein n=1 Tax=Eucalyptus globulus TaxID=34317 RepID=A0ABD3JEY5_EUCGL
MKKQSLTHPTEPANEAAQKFAFLLGKPRGLVEVLGSPHEPTGAIKSASTSCSHLALNIVARMPSTKGLYSRLFYSDSNGSQTILPCVTYSTMPYARWQELQNIASVKKCSTSASGLY